MFLLYKVTTMKIQEKNDFLLIECPGVLALRSDEKYFPALNAKSMQTPGIEANITQIQPSKPNGKLLKLQIVKLQKEHMANKLFTKRPLSNLKRTKN